MCRQKGEGHLPNELLHAYPYKPAFSSKITSCMRFKTPFNSTFRVAAKNGSYSRLDKI